MMKKYKLRFLTSGLAAATMLLAYSSAFGAHPNVTLKNYGGGTVGVNDAYSPKNTCAGCHFDCATLDTTADPSTWCDGTAGKLQKDCTVDACPDYASTDTKDSVHTQGVRDSGDQIYWQSSTTTSPMHGVSISAHVQQGRNEDYNGQMRAAFSDDFFTSSPGMFGKY